jgi:hypothetical protein
MDAIGSDGLRRDVELSIQRRSDEASLVRPDGPLVFPATTNGDVALGIFVADLRALHAAVRGGLFGALPPMLDDVEAMEQRLNALLS